MQSVSLPVISPRSRSSLLLALTAVLLLRSRLIDVPKEALLRLRSATYKTKLSPDELAQALQQVYVDEADGSKTILVPHRNNISKVRNIAIKIYTYSELLLGHPSIEYPESDIPIDN